MGYVIHQLCHGLCNGLCHRLCHMWATPMCLKSRSNIKKPVRRILIITGFKILPVRGKVLNKRNSPDNEMPNQGIIRIRGQTNPIFKAQQYHTNLVRLFPLLCTQLARLVSVQHQCHLGRWADFLRVDGTAPGPFVVREWGYGEWAGAINPCKERRSPSTNHPFIFISSHYHNHDSNRKTIFGMPRYLSLFHNITLCLSPPLF